MSASVDELRATVENLSLSPLNALMVKEIVLKKVRICSYHNFLLFNRVGEIQIQKKKIQ